MCQKVVRSARDGSGGQLEMKKMKLENGEELDKVYLFWFSVCLVGGYVYPRK